MPRKKTKFNLISKKDLILLTALITAALLVFAFFGRSRAGGSILVITQDGKEVLREKLSEGKIFKVETEDGGYNMIETVRTDSGELGIVCTESSCPEQICVEKGIVVFTDDPIVCLPHRMTAKMIRE